MHQNVAIDACASVKLRTRGLCTKRVSAIHGHDIPGWQIVTAIECAAMVTAVALLTQERYARFQQCWVGRSVRRMAIGAIVRDRTMLPQEWAAFLGVAGVAGLVD